ncbi:MAG TPA: hypothetical protein VK149_01195 [Sideroxyarcus sp.]|nr:hypothetical protein [Sideroxyarcus sp.]
MIEYIFFDAALRDKFVTYAAEREVPCTATDDHMGLVVAIPEDIPEDVADELEEYYDTLEHEQEDLSRAEGELKRLAGFRFDLPDGQSRMLPLQAEMASRLLASFTLAEIQALFGEVARCTLNQNEEHLCQILAAQNGKH